MMDSWVLLCDWAGECVGRNMILHPPDHYFMNSDCQWINKMGLIFVQWEEAEAQRPSLFRSMNLQNCEALKRFLVHIGSKVGNTQVKIVSVWRSCHTDDVISLRPSKCWLAYFNVLVVKLSSKNTTSDPIESRCWRWFRGLELQTSDSTQ